VQFEILDMNTRRTIWQKEIAGTSKEIPQKETAKVIEENLKPNDYRNATSDFDAKWEKVEKSYWTFNGLEKMIVTFNFRNYIIYY